MIQVNTFAIQRKCTGTRFSIVLQHMIFGRQGLPVKPWATVGGVGGRGAGGRVWGRKLESISNLPFRGVS